MAPSRTDGSASPRRRNSWRTPPGVTAMAHPIQVINRLKNVRSPRAFTLIECMIASVVLALAVLGVSGALSVSTQQSDITDVNARSLSLAQEVMEQVSSVPFDPPPNNNHQAGGGDVGDVSGDMVLHM